MTEPNETNAAFRAKSETNTKRESRAEKKSFVFSPHLASRLALVSLSS